MIIRPNPVLEKPFVPTHTRTKDGLPAMLLGQHDGNVVFRVEDRVTSTSVDHFERTFNNG